MQYICYMLEMIVSSSHNRLPVRCGESLQKKKRPNRQRMSEEMPAKNERKKVKQCVANHECWVDFRCEQLRLRFGSFYGRYAAIIHIDQRCICMDVMWLLVYCYSNFGCGCCWFLTFTLYVVQMRSKMQTEGNQWKTARYDTKKKTKQNVMEQESKRAYDRMSTIWRFYRKCKQSENKRPNISNQTKTNQIKYYLKQFSNVLHLDRLFARFLCDFLLLPILAPNSTMEPHRQFSVWFFFLAVRFVLLNKCVCVCVCSTNEAKNKLKQEKNHANNEPKHNECENESKSELHMDFSCMLKSRLSGSNTLHSELK